MPPILYRKPPLVPCRKLGTFRQFYQNKLKKEATVSILETVQKEGTREIKRDIEYYNLDAIMSVGYRINSKNATLFRIWTTKALKQHITRGWTLNKKLLKSKESLYLEVLDNIQKLSKTNDQTSNTQMIKKR